MTETLGQVIRRLRVQAGYTLRAFAEKIEISAAHQSDIEHSRRMPGEDVLRRMAKALEKVGGSYETFQALDSRLEENVQEMVRANPEVGQLLRQVQQSGRSPRDVLKDLQKMLTEREEQDT